VSETTEGAVITAEARRARPVRAPGALWVGIVCAFAWGAAGCAGGRNRAETSPPPSRRVVVETSDGNVVQAAAEADAPRGGTPFPAARDPATPDLAERPATRPASLPPPKIIPDGDKATLIYPCRHAETETLRAAVEVLLSPEGAVHASAPLNAIVISDRATLIQSLLEVLQELDAPNNQLLVEARVVEVSASRDLEAEIRHAFTTPAGRSTFLQNSAVDLAAPGAATANQGLDVGLRVFDDDGKTLDTFFRLLNTRGRARVLSSPNLIVAPGQEASIITGEEVPVQSSTIAGGSITTATQFKRVGIKLRVTLLQLTNDMARLEINPEVSTVTGFTAAAEGQPANPIVAIRNVTSTLSLKDGEVLTVGGLLRNEKRRTTRGVPFLEDIPLAGLLFQSRFDTTVRTQLIFFLRVRIISSGEAEAIRAHRPGAGLNVLDPITDPPSLPQGEGRLPPNLKANQ
jgi:type II secretory pathway component GspD/PulD (secretin)